MTAPTHERVHQHVPTPRGRPVRQRLARLLTELLAPGFTSGVLLIVVIVHSAPSAAVALRWLVPALLFGCLLPILYLLRQVRRRRLSDIHIRVREQRPIPLLVGLASVLIGLTLLVLLGASREILAVIGAMAAGLVVAMLTSLVWKLSIHTGAIAGTVVVLALIFGPPLLVLEVLTGVVGWARVEVGDHTPGQVIAGGAIGTIVAAVVFPLLR
ncbi:MAG: phosphoesterase PA-phosphatase [Chloroflexota bacterium]